MDIMYILHTMEKTILEQHTGTSTDREFQGIILLKNPVSYTHLTLPTMRNV